MCGILCCVVFGSYSLETLSCPVCTPCQELLQLNHLLQNRGADISSEYCIPYQNPLTSVKIHLAGHVLWTSGSKPEPQPYIGENTYMLFNGDIYSFGDNIYTDTGESENDGHKLFELFRNSDNITSLLECVSKLRGPYAFVYLDLENDKLWFARDFFGRESLIVSFDEKSIMYISSVSNFTILFEVPASGVFCLEISSRKLNLYPWDCHEREQIKDLTWKFVDLMQMQGFHFSQTNTKIPCFSTVLLKTSDESSILDKLEGVSENINPQIQLENVGNILQKKVDEFLFHLRNSVRQRMKVKPSLCKNCSHEKTCSHSKISILFSGGLDSTVIAFLAAETLLPGESLDLINVAFFKDEKIHLDSSIPDRHTGLESYRVLRHIFEPRGVTLNFIPANISKSMVAQMRESRIRNLISPLKSVLDDSLGCCLWFATEGKCKLGINSPARIVLLGSGADELLGGYGRHRSAFERGGWSELRDEMQLEIDRISVRNMGRDNRIVSDHGVAPRIPFMDERVVTFLTRECDIWIKCCPLKNFGQRGLGEKILLRAAALKLVGPENCHLALFPKRAMQFGSRIAKLENLKEKGGDECQRLVLAIKN